MNKLFTAVVSSSDSTTYNIQVNPIGDTMSSVLQGIPITNVVSSLLGFKEAYLPAIGTIVLCYNAGPSYCYIIGMIPDTDLGDKIPFTSRTIIGAGNGNHDKQNSLGYDSDTAKLNIHNSNRPTDIVEGEYVRSNELGVLLGLFQEMACLKSSELAQVQTFLFDDLVRIISHNFEHFTSLGTFKVYHDGIGLNAEFGATGEAVEGLGRPAVDTRTGLEPVFEKDSEVKVSSDDKDDFVKFSDNDRIEAVERLKLFVGKLGDFLRLSLSLPDKDTEFALDGKVPDKPDFGLFDIHLASDGGLHVRSIKEIFVEKTNWIRIPRRIRKPEDPKGDSQVEYTEKELYKWDSETEYKGNPIGFFLQLRDYLSYAQEKLGYRNFRDHEKDFSVNEELDKEQEVDKIHKVDPETPVDYKYSLRRSGLYLLENGGVMIKDAFGSATIWEGGNIIQQPVKDYVIQPLRNFIVKAGQFSSISSRYDIDVTSSEGGIRNKAQKVIYNYSEEQGIILHSNSEDYSEGSFDSAVEDMGGIVLKSKKGIFTHSETLFNRVTDRFLLNAETLTMASSNAVNFKFTDMNLMLDKDLNVLARKSIVVAAGSSLNMVGKSGTNIGQKDKQVGIVPDPECEAPMCPLLGALDADDFTTIMDAFDDYPLQEGMPSFSDDDKFDDIVFRFLDSSSYGFEDSDGMFQTIAQQDNEILDHLDLEVWEEKEINETFPYPGKDKFDSKFFVTSKLNNLQKVDDDLFAEQVDNIENEAKLERKSLNEYKVIPKF